MSSRGLAPWCALLGLSGGCAASTPPPASGACAPPLPHESFALTSATLGEARQINVFLPPAYTEDPAARFPVLYMPDGGLEEDFIHVADAIQAGALWGTLRPVIVVGIENTERRRDLTGPTEVEEDKKIAPRVGGSAAFRAFLRDELMPQIRARYRTTEETAVVGESLAGLFVLETFLLEPALFGAFIAISPSVWWNGGALVAGAEARLKALPTPPPKLYLTVANEENIVPALERLVPLLGAVEGLVWQYHPMPAEHHDTIYRASSPRAFRWLFGAPDAPP